MFFSGWSMEPCFFQGMIPTGHDLFFLYDYRDLHLQNIDLPALIHQYEQIHCIAWSMGVWVAAILATKHPALIFSSATAIGGTVRPIDPDYGIAPDFFHSMADNCTQETLTVFYNSMFEREGEKKRFFSEQRKRRSEEICQELEQLIDLYRQHGPAQDIYGKHIVTSRDRVFTSRNQIRAWGGKTNCLTSKAPHFPFYTWAGLLPPDEKKDAGR